MVIAKKKNPENEDLRPENKDPRKIVGKHPKTWTWIVEDPQKHRVKNEDPLIFFPLQLTPNNLNLISANSNKSRFLLVFCIVRVPSYIYYSFTLSNSNPQ